MMHRFLPSQFAPKKRWAWGWHTLPDETPWYGDSGNGDDKAKEGYMPIKEEDEEKFWKLQHWGRY